MLQDIFRVEDSVGTGYYYAGGCNNCISSSRHPVPNDDPLLGHIWNDLKNHEEHSNYRFGFKSIELLNQWFIVADRWEMLEENFRVVHLSVTDTMKGFHRSVYHGETQSIFLPEYAEVVNVLSPIEI